MFLVVPQMSALQDGQALITFPKKFCSVLAGIGDQGVEVVLADVFHLVEEAHDQGDRGFLVLGVAEFVLVDDKGL